MASRLKLFAADYTAFDRNARLLLVSAIGRGVTYGLFEVILPFYLLEARYDATLIGVVGALAGTTRAILIIPCGMVADMLGRKRVVLAGSCLSVAGLTSIAFSPAFSIVAFGALLFGAGGALTSVIGPLLAGSVSREKLDSVFSVQSFLETIAFSAGAAMGWLPSLLSSFATLTTLASFQIVMLIGALSMATSLAPVGLASEQARGTRVGGSRWKLRSTKYAMKFGTVYSVLGFGAGLTIPLFPVYFNRKFGVESGEMGSLIALSSIVGALAFLTGPALAKRFGSVRAVAYTVTGGIPLLALIIVAPSFGYAAPLFITRQALANIGNPLIFATLMRVIPEEERATAGGLLNFLNIVPNSTAQPLGGYMIDNIWLDLPLVTTTFFYTAFAALFYGLFHNVNSPVPVDMQQETTW